MKSSRAEIGGLFEEIDIMCWNYAYVDSIFVLNMIFNSGFCLQNVT